MNEKRREQVKLECLYEMFRDRVEENVIYIVYSENEGKIDSTIDQLMSIAACSFTGHQFEPKPLNVQTFNRATTSPLTLGTRAVNSPELIHSIGAVASRYVEQDPEAKSGLDCTGNDADQEGIGIEERIERLQQAINDLLEEKRLSHDKASHYISKKMYSVGGYYTQLSSQYYTMIEKKTDQLVDLLLQKSENSNQIDLHGLNVVQASLVVSKLLNIRQNNLVIDKKNETSIDIITGWGRHSTSPGHRIRPKIVALLREKGFEYQHLNKGAIRVTIRR